MSVRLHIERLVLDGFVVPHADRPLLQAAIEQELHRLIAEGGVSAAFSAGLAVPVLRGPDIRLGETAGPTALGGHIAGALYQGLRR